MRVPVTTSLTIILSKSTYLSGFFTPKQIYRKIKDHLLVTLVNSLYFYFLNNLPDSSMPMPPIEMKSIARINKSSADKSKNISFIKAMANMIKPESRSIRKCRTAPSQSDRLAVRKSVIVVSAMLSFQSSKSL